MMVNERHEVAASQDLEETEVGNGLAIADRSFEFDVPQRKRETLNLAMMQKAGPWDPTKSNQ
jgi:hypothetical protein